MTPVVASVRIKKQNSSVYSTTKKDCWEIDYTCTLLYIKDKSWIDELLLNRFIKYKKKLSPNIDHV